MQCLLFHSIELSQQTADALFREPEILSLILDFLELLEVLFVPLLAVAVLPRERLQPLARLLDESLQLCLSRSLNLLLAENALVKAAQFRDNQLRILAHFDCFVDSNSSLFHSSGLLPKLLELILVERARVIGVQERLQIGLLLRELSLKEG